MRGIKNVNEKTLRKKALGEEKIAPHRRDQIPKKKIGKGCGE
jgi:hypothetical protein